MRPPCSVADCGKPNVARALCGMHYARWRKRGTTELPPVTQSPGWGAGRAGEGSRRYWTKARIVSALRRYAAENPGPLTGNDHAWSAIKKGRLDLPTAGAVLAISHSFAHAWLAVGVDRSRVSLLNSRWTKAEKAYLLEHAGTMTLERIARDLNRSYASAKTMIGSKGMGITARANNGYWSAAMLAREYGCPVSRVVALLEVGAIKGFPHLHRCSWQIDPADVTPELVAELRRPRKNYKVSPPDLGDYRARYGIRRLAAVAS